MIRVLLAFIVCVPLVSNAFQLSIRKFLFVDDRWIARTYQVVRVVPPPLKEKNNPVLVPDRPWEGKDIYVYGTVLLEQGKFRMWYQIYNSSEPAGSRFQTAVAYAESKDGIRWTKPMMDHVKYKGQPTNIVLLSHGTSALVSPAVVKDLAEKDPSKRYKMLYYDSMSKEDLANEGSNLPLGVDVPGWKAIPGEGFFTAVSPDGLKWTNTSPQPIFTCPCDASSLNRSFDGTFHAYYKTSIAPDRHFRILGHSSSRDFRTWTEPTVILEPDWKDPHGTEFYGMSYLPYFGNDLGLIWMYHNAPNDKHVDVQLASKASDGSWQRAADRRVFLGTGGLGEWDGGGVYPASDVLVAPPEFPDEAWLYYGGSSVFHDDSRFRETSIGLARFRLDGFVAMRSLQFAGWLESNPLVTEGGYLYVNADCSHGTMKIEVLDAATGMPITAAVQLQGMDKTKIQVSAEEIPAGKKIILRFSMQKSDLYSFWFERP